VLAATNCEPQRGMDELNFQAAVLEEKNVATEALLLGAQHQVEMEREEASVAGIFLRADIVTNDIPMLDESDMS
jgi:hypothetical protein